MKDHRMKRPSYRHLALGCAMGFWLGAGPLAASLSGQEVYEWKGGKWVRAAKPARGTPPGELALVRQLFQDGRYKKTVKAAKKFRSKYQADPGYEEVCLLAGRAEIKRGRYYQAFEWFEKQLDQHPAGRLSDRALQREFEVAEAFLGGKKRVILGFIRIGAVDDGLEILTRIAEHAPGTNIAAKSLLRIADYHYQKGQWVEAAEAYDLFLDLFGKSPEAARAMLQAAQATYSSFRGIRFDDTPLLEAEQRFSIFAESYPAAARKAGVGRMLKQIAFARGEKLYQTGRFYERTKRPSAAAFYYKQLINAYPETQWAVDARTALRLLGDVEPRRPAPTTEAQGNPEGGGARRQLSGTVGPPTPPATRPVRRKDVPTRYRKAK